MEQEEYSPVPALRNITISKVTFIDYIKERRFSMLDFFLLMCMISIPSIVYGVASHLWGA